MRSDEICRLRLGDITFSTQKMFVRLPNKALKERIAFFSDRTTASVKKWLEVRKEACGHDFLFQNYLGDPLSTNSIQKEFNRSLCRTYQGRTTNEIGLETFSVHRLRHTLTSNLVMSSADAETVLSVLGWAGISTMEGYVKLSEETKIRGFAEACERLEQQDGQRFATRVLTNKEFLDWANDEAA